MNIVAWSALALGILNVVVWAAVVIGVRTLVRQYKEQYGPLLSMFTTPADSVATGNSTTSQTEITYTLGRDS